MVTASHAADRPMRLPTVRRQVAHAAAVCGGFTLALAWVFARPIVHGTYLSTTDLFDYYLPSFLSPAAIWSSYEYAGTPVFADPEAAPYYPLRLFFADVAGSWTGFIVSAYVVAACALYAYVRAHTGSWRAAVVAGLSFALSEAMLERLAHPTIVHAVAWVPLVLLAIDRVCAGRRRWLWAAIGGLATANCLLSGHPQLPLYTAYLCAAYGCCAAVCGRCDWRAWAALGVIAVSGLLVSAINILPLAEISRDAARQAVSFEDFVSYANSLPQMLTIAFPRLAHPGLESPTYVGLGVLMLAPLGAAQFRANWRVAFWTIVVAVMLLLGAGAATPMAAFVHELPLYDRFRIVSRHLMFAALGFTVLAGFGVARLERGNVRLSAVAWSVLPTVILIAAGALVVARWSVAFPPDAGVQAGALAAGGTGVGVQVVLALSALAACLGLWRHPRSAAATIVLLLVIAGDLLLALPWKVSAAGVAFETVPRQAMTPSVHVERLRARLAPTAQRLLTPGGARGNEVIAGPRARLWRLPIANGYSSVQLDRYASLLPSVGTGRIDPGSLRPESTALDLLAVRYVLIQAGAEDEPLLRHDADRWQEVERFSTSLVSDRGGDEAAAGETEYVVYENRRARPRAWLAAEVRPVTDGVLADAIHGSRLSGGPFEAGRTALVDEGAMPARTYGAGPRDATVESIRDSMIRVRTRSASGGFLVLSESYYHGWQAGIDDGAPRPVVRTDAALQGIDVPPGEHVVTFEFAAPARRAGMLLSGIGLMMIGACVVTSIRRSS